MEIRPHRRIVIPFEPPLFTELSAVADFAGEYYEHFGAALFGPGAVASCGIGIYRRMCNSLGLKMVVDCRFDFEGSPDDASRPCLAAATIGSDYVVVSSSLGAGPVSSVASFCKPGSFVLVAVGSPSECPQFSSPSAGFACDLSSVASVRAVGSFPLIVLDCPDLDSAVAAVKDGADLVVVGEPIVRAERPDRAARDLAERFRAFT